MKKTFSVIALIALVMLAGVPAWAQRYSVALSTTSPNVAASGTATNGTEFTSTEVSVPASVSSALLTLTFTRATGSATLAVDFYFQVSYDNGTTWADLHDAVSDADYLSVLTGHAVVTGTTVRVSRTIILNGVSHIRLSKIVNNDSGNNLTACNATISW